MDKATQNGCKQCLAVVIFESHCHQRPSVSNSITTLSHGEENADMLMVSVVCEGKGLTMRECCNK
jgi:hypothetical protein